MLFYTRVCIILHAAGYYTRVCIILHAPTNFTRTCVKRVYNFRRAGWVRVYNFTRKGKTYPAQQYCVCKIPRVYNLYTRVYNFTRVCKIVSKTCFLHARPNNDL